MTDEEWLQTPAGDAILTFLSLMTGLLVSAMGGALGGIATKVISAFATWQLDKKQGQLTDVQRLAESKLRTFLDPQRDDALRNGLTLVASWSSFEATFEDFCRALIQERPEVLKDSDLARLKVPMTKLFTAADERAATIYEGIENSVGKKAAVTRCEDILKFLDLSGNVPRPIKDEIFNSQMIRHVWAHRVGIADESFVAKAPHLGFSVGELVAVDIKQLVVYLNALLIYASILANRHRALHGLPPLTDSFKPKEGKDNTLQDAYHSLYTTANSAPGTSPSGSDAPPVSPVPPTAEAPPTQTSSPDSTQDPTP